MLPQVRPHYLRTDAAGAGLRGWSRDPHQNARLHSHSEEPWLHTEEPRLHVEELLLRGGARLLFGLRKGIFGPPATWTRGV